MERISTPSFSRGDRVRKIKDHTQVGIIIGEYQESQNESGSPLCGYVVQFPGTGAASKQPLPADAIELDVEATELILDERRIVSASSDEIFQTIRNIRRFFSAMVVFGALVLCSSALALIAL